MSDDMRTLPPAPHRKTISRRVVVTGAAIGGVAVIAGGAIALGGRGGRLVPGVARAARVHSDAALPKHVDVVVIGGGYVGTSAALSLVERGLSVALCEKGVIAGEASGRSLGWIDGMLHDAITLPLIARSKDLWSRMNSRTGLETGYLRNGILQTTASEEELSFFQQWVASARGMPSVDARILNSAETAKQVPGATSRFAGAIYQPSDAQTDPRLSAPAMAMAAQRQGARIFQGCAVRGLETTGGRISGVITEKGAIRAPAVIYAGGAWSSLFMRSIGLSLPQFDSFSSLMTISPVAGPSVAALVGGHLGWKRNRDGSYVVGKLAGVIPIQPDTIRYATRLIPAIKANWDITHPVFTPSTFWKKLTTPSHWKMDEVSPFEQTRILMPEVNNADLDESMEGLKSLYPVFRGATTGERWAGAISVTLDNLPVIAPIISKPGLAVGTGFYFGATMGPAAGEALADIVTGRKAQFDLSPFRYERLIDGSDLPYHW